MAKFISSLELLDHPSFARFREMAQTFDTKRARDKRTGDVIFEPDSLEVIPGALLSGWVTAGGRIEDVELFLKMPLSTYRAEVPAGVENRDDGGQVRTWEQWKAPQNSHLDAPDGDKLVSCSSWGRFWTQSELSTLASAGYTFLLAHEVQTLLAS